MQTGEQLVLELAGPLLGGRDRRGAGRLAVLAAGGDEATADFLFRTPVGLGCLTAGLALDGLAAWWMARLTRIDA